MTTSRAIRASSPFTFLAAAALLASFGPLAACSGASTSSGPSDTTASAAAAEVIAASDAGGAATADHPMGPPHGHPGPDFLVVAALHESIGLTADQQKTIEALLPSDPSAHPGGPRPFDKTRAAALAASIRAGKVVAPAMTPPTEDEVASHRAQAASAIGALHATLTAAQRKALVAALEQREAAHDKDGGDHHDGPMDHDRRGKGGRGPMGPLLEGLDVTAAQQQQIDAKLEAARPALPSDSDRAAMQAQHDTMRAAMKTKLESFANDSFDATAFVTPPAGGAKPPPGDHPDRFIADLAVVTSVLDATQREKLAERIEAGPAAFGQHGPPPGDQ